MGLVMIGLTFFGTLAIPCVAFLAHLAGALAA